MAQTLNAQSIRQQVLLQKMYKKNQQNSYTPQTTIKSTSLFIKVLSLNYDANRPTKDNSIIGSYIDEHNEIQYVEIFLDESAKNYDQARGTVFDKNFNKRITQELRNLNRSNSHYTAEVLDLNYDLYHQDPHSVFHLLNSVKQCLQTKENNPAETIPILQNKIPLFLHCDGIKFIKHSQTTLEDGKVVQTICYTSRWISYTPYGVVFTNNLHENRPISFSSYAYHLPSSDPEKKGKKWASVLSTCHVWLGKDESHYTTPILFSDEKGIQQLKNVFKDTREITNILADPDKHKDVLSLSQENYRFNEILSDITQRAKDYPTMLNKRIHYMFLILRKTTEEDLKLVSLNPNNQKMQHSWALLATDNQLHGIRDDFSLDTTFDSDGNEILKTDMDGNYIVNYIEVTDKNGKTSVKRVLYDDDDIDMSMQAFRESVKDPNSKIYSALLKTNENENGLTDAEIQNLNDDNFALIYTNSYSMYGYEQQNPQNLKEQIKILLNTLSYDLTNIVNANISEEEKRKQWNSKIDQFIRSPIDRKNNLKPTTKDYESNQLFLMLRHVALYDYDGIPRVMNGNSLIANAVAKHKTSATGNLVRIGILHASIGSAAGGNLNIHQDKMCFYSSIYKVTQSNFAQHLVAWLHSPQENNEQDTVLVPKVVYNKDNSVLKNDIENESESENDAIPHDTLSDQSQNFEQDLRKEVETDTNVQNTNLNEEDIPF